MPTTLTNTGITFNNGTVQTTAAVTGSVVSGTAYSGYTGGYSTGPSASFDGYAVARAIAGLGGSEILCRIEFAYSTAVVGSDGFLLGYRTFQARRLYRTVS